ncbi:MAG: tol-pal system protein YbgF [Rhodocyclaceae bacterium]
MTKTKLLPRAVLVAALWFALPAQAGLFDDDEARARLDQLRRELGARIDKVESGQRGQIELSNQIETLRQETSSLRGQVEVLTHQIQELQKRQQDLYIDLDTRLRKLEPTPKADDPRAENGGVPPAVGAGAAARADSSGEIAKSNPQAESRDYEAALNLFKAGKYKESAAAFESFIKNHGSSGFLASAHYWLGNSLYQVRDYKRAKETFQKVPSNWPKDPKAPDALLGVANCQLDGGDMKSYRATLTALIAKYPTSTAAQIAKQRLGKKK